MELMKIEKSKGESVLPEERQHYDGMSMTDHHLYVCFLNGHVVRRPTIQDFIVEILKYEYISLLIM